jgi:hypothetical protein
MKLQQTKPSKKLIILLSVFLLVWGSFTIWLNIEHQKDIKVLSKIHDVSLNATQKSDLIYSSFITSHPKIHSVKVELYKDQLIKLISIKHELNGLWPNTPEGLVSGIDDLLVSYRNLNLNPESEEFNKSFSDANAYLFDMSYHEYSIARSDMRYQNLPLFLVLAVAIMLFIKYSEQLNVSISLGTKLEHEKSKA